MYFTSYWSHKTRAVRLNIYIKSMIPTSCISIHMYIFSSDSLMFFSLKSQTFFSSRKWEKGFPFRACIPWINLNPEFILVDYIWFPVNSGLQTSREKLFKDICYSHPRPASTRLILNVSVHNSCAISYFTRQLCWKPTQVITGKCIDIELYHLSGHIFKANISHI